MTSRQTKPNGNGGFGARILALVAGGLLVATVSKAEMFVGVYGGWCTTPDTDVHLKQPGGTDLTFKNVPWNGESFESPYYYGLKLGYWFKQAPNWGIAAEFTHAKMIADLAKTVGVTGVREGVAVNGQEPLGNTFQNLQFTHGQNFLTLNVQHRWFLASPGSHAFLARFQPYLGTGAGVTLSHVEVKTAATAVGEYQFTGVAWQGYAGLNFDVTKYISLFTEYKATFADVDGDLPGGGSIGVQPWTHHIVFGVAVSLGSRGHNHGTLFD